MMAIAQHASVVTDWVIGGGGLTIAGAIFKLATNVGRMTQLLEDHDARIRRLESINDRRA